MVVKLPFISVEQAIKQPINGLIDCFLSQIWKFYGAQADVAQQ